MNWLDWTMVALYLCGLVGVSLHFRKNLADTEDYFLGGRNLPWWAIALSTMATQLGAVSFISAPAFVGLKEGGGLIWLGYEFAVPVAMILIMTSLLPELHRGHFISIYEYLERRFDAGTRSLISLVFQLSRALATGVTVYAVAIVLAVVLGLEIWVTILLTAVVAILYDIMGGMRAVVFTDVVQMGVLLAGILLCSGYALFLVGDWQGVVEALSPERWRSIDWGGHGWGDGREFGFWPLVLGGFFLYVSYYGCDQSQVQRELSARNEDDLKRSLFFNGVARFPLVLGYCLMGLMIAALAAREPGFAALLRGKPPDYMVPFFILTYLPHGLIGLLIIAILAAAMSSLDSALNSLSAATFRDLYQRYWDPSCTPEKGVNVCRWITLFWGVFCTSFAFLVGRMEGTIIEAINKIGSAFYGPILATFLLGIWTGVPARTVRLGVLGGVGANLALWLGMPQVSWLWWNLVGFAVTWLLACLVARHRPFPHLGGAVVGNGWRPAYLFLALYFLLIILFAQVLSLRYGP